MEPNAGTHKDSWDGCWAPSYRTFPPPTLADLPSIFVLFFLTRHRLKLREVKMEGRAAARLFTLSIRAGLLLALSIVQSRSRDSAAIWVPCHLYEGSWQPPERGWRLLRLRGGDASGARRDRAADIGSAAGVPRLHEGATAEPVLRRRRGRGRVSTAATVEDDAPDREGFRAVSVLPPELREGVSSIDQWGRPIADANCGAESGRQSRLRGAVRRRKREMITFDLAELFPRCQGLGLNFTSPLRPTPTEFGAAVAAAQRQLAGRVARMSPHELVAHARDGLATGDAKELICNGSLPEFVKVILGPTSPSSMCLCVSRAV